MRIALRNDDSGISDVSNTTMRAVLGSTGRTDSGLVQGVHQVQVVRVVGLMLIAGVKVALLLDRKAIDPASVQHCDCEGVRRVVEVRSVQPSLAAMTAVVERHGVYVNPAIARSSQFDPHGQPVDVGDVPEIDERLEARLQVVGIDREIKIPVFPGLPPNQHVNAPATTDPVSDS